MSRPRLALAWPTYNRSQEIAEHLASIASEANTLGVTLFISDDSHDDATKTVVESFAAKTPGIHYRHNVPPLRHDANLISTLAWPDADYIWLIRDKMHPVPGILECILSFLENQDMVFVNSHSDDHRMIPSVDGEEARALTRDLLWHQTSTGATIYSRRVCEHATTVKLWPNFPQLSVILSQLSAGTVTIGWFGERSLVIVPNSSESYWKASAIDVFVRDWAAVVVAFPKVIPPQQRASVIGKHATQTHIFDAKTLLELRLHGQFKYSSLKHPWFLEAIQKPRWKLLTLLALPRPLIRWIVGSR